MVALFYIGTLFAPTIIKEFKLGKPNSSYRCSKDFRSPSNLTLYYRSTQILLLYANIALGPFIIPMHTASTMLFVYGLNIFITRGKSMAVIARALVLIWAILGAGAWGLALLVGGYVHLQGTKCLKSWKLFCWENKREQKYMSKFRKSCRPWAIGYGNMLRVRRTSLLKFFKGLSKGLMRALLTLGK